MVVLLLAVANLLYVSQVTEPPAPTSECCARQWSSPLPRRRRNWSSLSGDDPGHLYLEGENSGRLYLEDFEDKSDEVGKYGPKRLYLLDEDE